ESGAHGSSPGSTCSSHACAEATVSSYRSIGAASPYPVTPSCVSATSTSSTSSCVSREITNVSASGKGTMRASSCKRARLVRQAPVAQGIERVPPEHEVAGSIPAGRILISPGQRGHSERRGHLPSGLNRPAAKLLQRSGPSYRFARELDLPCAGLRVGSKRRSRPWTKCRWSLALSRRSRARITVQRWTRCTPWRNVASAGNLEEPHLADRVDRAISLFERGQIKKAGRLLASLRRSAADANELRRLADLDEVVVQMRAHLTAEELEVFEGAIPTTTVTPALMPGGGFEWALAWVSALALLFLILGWRTAASIGCAYAEGETIEVLPWWVFLGLTFLVSVVLACSAPFLRHQRLKVILGHVALTGGALTALTLVWWYYSSPYELPCSVERVRTL